VANIAWLGKKIPFAAVRLLRAVSPTRTASTSWATAIQLASTSITSRHLAPGFGWDGCNSKALRPRVLRADPVRLADEATSCDVACLILVKTPGLHDPSPEATGAARIALKLAQA